MRLLGFAALAGIAFAVPAAAQKQPNVDRRVEKLEAELRAVQRKVFPAGNVEPEIRSEAAVSAPGGVPATGAIADLTQRIDALEAQLARVTSQNEEANNRVRVLEEALTRFRGDADFRLSAIEGGRGGPPPQPAAEATPLPAPAQPRAELAAAQTVAPAPTPAPTPTSAEDPAADPSDPAEAAYITGFRMWEGKRYADAAPVLEDMAKKFPRHRRASYAQNLAGRAYLDSDKPATAAKLLLANYQANPKGERAADSLYFLGQALARLDKNAEACKVYDELREVYPDMRDWLKQRLPQARQQAKCAG